MGRPLVPRPWSFEPLAARIGGSRNDQAARLGTTQRSVCRWLHTGLTDEQADYFAIRIGLHPALVWPGWHEAAFPDWGVVDHDAELHDVA